MKRFGKLDKRIFLEFQNDQERLHQIAEKIRSTLQDEDVVHRLYQMYEEEDRSLLWEVKEGKVLYKLHKFRERNHTIVKEKKYQFMKDHKALFCEACTFNFEKQYGTLGKDYIECHHRIPLSESSSVQITSLSDLALVCSNCHRMLHRDISHLSVERLREIVLRPT
jgi:5-methylcytosine-specific restriction protein A